jgi:dCMP deaminase
MDPRSPVNGFKASGSHLVATQAILMAHNIAVGEAQRSNCVRRQVGAVMLAQGGYQVSLGHNRVGIGLAQCDVQCPRARRSYDEVPAFSDYTAPGAECYAIHAEAMAIKKVEHLDMEGCVLVVTCEPCAGCQELIDSVGLVAVWPED